MLPRHFFIFNDFSISTKRSIESFEVIFVNLFCWDIAGLVFTIIFGSLLHFTYRWSNENQIVGLFSPVNESVWEHLKMLFFPMLLFSIVEYFAVGYRYNNFIFSKSFGIVLGLIAIVAVFYTYTGIIGKNYLVADILTFVFGVAVAYLYSWYSIHHNSVNPAAGIFLMLTFLAAFLLFTYEHPRIQLFIDPTTKR